MKGRDPSPTRPRRALQTAGLVACITLVASPALAQEATPSDGLALPDRSISAQDDAASVEVNPAGLGFMQNAEFQYNLQLATSDFARTVDAGHAVFLAAGGGGFGLGFGAQWLFSPGIGGPEVSGDYRKYTFAGALGDGDTFSLGFAYNFFGSRSSRELDELQGWDLGAQLRLNQYLGLGLFARDLNGPFLGEGDALPIRWGAGLVLRLLDGRIQLDTQAAHVQDSEQVVLTPRVVLEAIGGMRLFGRADFTVATGANGGVSGLDSVISGLEISMGSFGAQGALIAQAGDEATDLTGHAYTLWAAPSKKRGLIDINERWILLELNGPLSDLPSGGLFSPASQSFIDLLVKLDQIANDPDVEGVVFNVAGPSLGYGQLWELRQRIDALRQAGKKTATVLQTADKRSVMLASATEKIWMLPNIVYEPLGVAAQIVTYQGALAKLGVEAEFIRVRDYKTSPEAYVNSEPSPESLEQTGDYVGHIWDALVDSIATGRSKKKDEVVDVIENLPLLPDEALERGYVDDVLYADEIEDKLKETYGKRISLQRGYRPAPTSEEHWRRRPEIAVVVVSGPIVQGDSGASPIGDGAMSGAGTVIGALQRVRKDRNVRAVILRVDSPGGSALASDQIYRELRRLAQKKPVIASMGNIAASGGYYVSAGAEEIFATPLTLTGSIGIFGGKASLSRLGDRIGVNTTKVEKGPLASTYSLLTPFTPAQRKFLARNLIYLYRLFLNQIANTRELTADEIDAVARGRVWTGSAALERKLVDRSGGLIDAIRHAEELTDLDPREANYVVYPNASSNIGAIAGAQLATARLRQALRPAPPEQVETLVRLAAPFELLLERVDDSVLLPLLYEEGEALMLPTMAIEID